MNNQITEAQSKPSLLENVFEFIEIAVSALVLVAILFAFFIRIVGVDGDSMNDTLIDGDHLIVSKAFYTPERGDIVVVTRENDTALIKRVIAVAGDTIEINPFTYEVKLNGAVIDEPYVHYNTLSYDVKEPITVPEGHVFVMGDHRDNSYDSRKSALGCIPVDDVIGKAVWRFLPLDSFGGIYDNLNG